MIHRVKKNLNTSQTTFKQRKKSHSQKEENSFAENLKN